MDPAPHPVHIRHARPDEQALLATIAYAAKAYWGYADEVLEAWRPELTPSTLSLANAPTFVAEIDNQVAGWCQVDQGSKPVSLAHFWVHPDFHRRGAGRALLAAVTDHLKTVRITALAIDADPNAEDFYTACGAVRVGTRKAPIPGHAARVRPQLLLQLEDRS